MKKEEMEGSCRGEGDGREGQEMRGVGEGKAGNGGRNCSATFECLPRVCSRFHMTINYSDLYKRSRRRRSFSNRTPTSSATEAEEENVVQL
jgi:hypothetical protein